MFAPFHIYLSRLDFYIGNFCLNTWGPSALAYSLSESMCVGTWFAKNGRHCTLHSPSRFFFEQVHCDLIVDILTCELNNVFVFQCFYEKSGDIICNVPNIWTSIQIQALQTFLKTLRLFLPIIIHHFEPLFICPRTSFRNRHQLAQLGFITQEDIFKIF